MAKKKKKEKAFKKLFTGLVVIFLIIVIGFLGYKSYIELDGIRNDIENFEYQTPSEFVDKVDLPTSIGDKIVIEWNSSNQNVISNNGEISFPDFEEGDVEVRARITNLDEGNWRPRS